MVSLVQLMCSHDERGDALAFADLLLRPSHSNILPRDTKPAGRFSRNIPVQTPIASAAMSTVTTKRMAIAMAMNGGIGVIHPALEPDVQYQLVRKVKLHLHARIDAPITIDPEMSLGELAAWRTEKDYGFETFPVVNALNVFDGVITAKDVRFFSDQTTKVRDAMTPFDKLQCGDPDTSLKQAHEMMLKSRVHVLPLVRPGTQSLTGLYLAADVERAMAPHSNYTLDQNGHLRVAASIGVGDDALLRAELLARAGCDAFVVGTAHADTTSALDTVRRLKAQYPHIDVVAGNTSYAEGAVRLADAGADGILVGQGPGSICTTRIVAGIGVPQASAVFECAHAVQQFGIPVIADGGITTSGDIAKALALGAECVMLGGLLAGTDESPGEMRTLNGLPVKVYYGMGSQRAMSESAAARKRYGQHGIASGKRTPEGDEGYVPYRGPVAKVIAELVGGLQASMGYLGVDNILDMRAASAVRITHAGLIESRPHDLIRD